MINRILRMAHRVRPSSSARAARRSLRNRGASGFSLIEVLVALAIVAVALAACVRAAGQLASNHAMMSERAWALVSAQNAVAEIRAQRIYPAVGRSAQPCPQGRMAFVCERYVEATANNSFRDVTVRVSQADDGRVLTELRALASAWP